MAPVARTLTLIQTDHHARVGARGPARGAPVTGRVDAGLRDDERVFVFGVEIASLTKAKAVSLIEQWIIERRRAHSVFIANAHTLNVATEDPGYRALLDAANMVLADGTGVRWASRLRGVRLQDNLVGTDLIPHLFQTTAGRGYRYFLLGATTRTAERAARTCSAAYPGWTLAGFHHGYLGAGETSSVIRRINRARPDLLLVAMGNPLQEQWIHSNLARLRVPVCMGVGGLLDHWSGNLKRAPLWVRRRGFEWLQILFQQPHKWRRYLLGNPRFLVRMVRELRRDRRLMAEAGRRGDRRLDERPAAPSVSDARALAGGS